MNNAIISSKNLVSFNTSGILQSCKGHIFRYGPIVLTALTNLAECTVFKLFPCGFEGKFTDTNGMITSYVRTGDEFYVEIDADIAVTHIKITVIAHAICQTNYSTIIPHSPCDEDHRNQSITLRLGGISLYCLDQDDPNIMIGESKFSLYNNQGSFLCDNTTDNYGVTDFWSLYPGIYTIKQKSVPSPYKVADAPISVEVTSNQTHITTFN